MAKGISYLRGEAIAPVAQEDLGTRAIELVLEHSIDAMLLGLEVGAEIPLPERGVVHVQFEALLRAVEVGIMATLFRCRPRGLDDTSSFRTQGAQESTPTTSR